MPMLPIVKLPMSYFHLFSSGRISSKNYGLKVFIRSLVYGCGIGQSELDIVVNLKVAGFKPYLNCGLWNGFLPCWAGIGT